MKCIRCNDTLIFRNDFDFQDYEIDDKDGIVSIYECLLCGAIYEIYLPELQPETEYLN